MNNEIDLLLNELRNTKPLEIPKEKPVKIKYENIVEQVIDLESLFEYLDVTKDELLPYPNPITSFEKYLNACVLISKIVNIYNQGTILNWDDHKEYKYLPYFKKIGSGLVYDGSSCFSDGSGGSVGHHYKSRELCDSGVKNFNWVYLDFYSYQG